MILDVCRLGQRRWVRPRRVLVRLPTDLEVVVLALAFPGTRVLLVGRDKQRFGVFERGEGEVDGALHELVGVGVGDVGSVDAGRGVVT